jgi:hypothetical protein
VFYKCNWKIEVEADEVDRFFTLLEDIESEEQTQK